MKKLTIILLIFPIISFSQCAPWGDMKLDEWRDSQTISDWKGNPLSFKTKDGLPCYYSLICASDFGIHPDDGIPDGKRLQGLIDSLQKTYFNSLIVLDESGKYCLDDVQGIHINHIHRDPNHGCIFMIFDSRFNGHLGPCDTPKKAF